MFSLLYGLYQYVFSKPEYNVLVIGLDYAGKTAFLEQVKHIYLGTSVLPPEKLMPTVGLNVGKIETSTTKFVFWDLGGASGLRSIWEKYYEETHALIYFVDSANIERFEESQNTLEQVLRQPELRDVPVLILANKQDIETAKTPEEVSQTILANRYPNRITHTLGMSTIHGNGVKQAMTWLEETLSKHARMIEKN